MTEEQLAAIEARHAPKEPGLCAHCVEYTDSISADVAALVTEVRALQAAVRLWASNERERELAEREAPA